MFNSMTEIINARRWEWGCYNTGGSGYNAGLFHNAHRLTMPQLAGLTAAGSTNGATLDKTNTSSLPLPPVISSEVIHLEEIIFSNHDSAGRHVTICLYDRLWHNSELAGNTTALQSFTQPALTRYTNGVGNQLWFEAWASMGGSATTITASYTNENGVSGRTATFSYSSTYSIYRMGQFQLQAGDTGIQSVQSVQLAGSTGSAGNFGVLITHPVVFLSSIVTQGEGRSNQIDESQLLNIGWPEIDSDAALFICGSPASGNWPTQSIRFRYIIGS